MEWLIARIGAKWATRLMWSVGIAAFLGAVFLLGRCTAGDDDPTPQIQQSNRSAEAMGKAAESAVNAVTDLVITEQSVDAAVRDATQEIDNAKDVDAVRDAVLDSLCGRATHRDDPACKLHRSNSR